MTDSTIIARAGVHEVHRQRHEVMFKDCSAVTLHPVSRAGVPHVTLRCLATDGGGLLLFDLANLDDGLGRELRFAAERDRPGYVLHTMRARYPSKAQFILDVRRHALASIDPPLQVAA